MSKKKPAAAQRFKRLPHALEDPWLSFMSALVVLVSYAARLCTRRSLMMRSTGSVGGSLYLEAPDLEARVNDE